MKQNMVMCPKCGAKFHRWGHMQVFDRETMREILEKKGFEIVKMNVLPIGFMTKHRFLRHFRWFLQKLGFIQSKNLFVVAVKR